MGKNINVVHDLEMCAKYFADEKVIFPINEAQSLSVRFICEAAIHEINRLRTTIWGDPVNWPVDD